VRTLILEWAMPSVRALPKTHWAKGRTRGLAQTPVKLGGEAEPRLTSGGEAAAVRPYNFVRSRSCARPQNFAQSRNSAPNDFRAKHCRTIEPQKGT